MCQNDNPRCQQRYVGFHWVQNVSEMEGCVEKIDRSSAVRYECNMLKPQMLEQRRYDLKPGLYTMLQVDRGRSSQPWSVDADDADT